MCGLFLFFFLIWFSYIFFFWFQEKKTEKEGWVNKMHTNGIYGFNYFK